VSSEEFAKVDRRRLIVFRQEFDLAVKRVFDSLVALALIAILAPLFAIIAGLVRVKLGSPILYSQKRPGLGEKIFTMYKFRSMTNERDELGNLLPDQMRLTAFGAFLRSSSLDELPGLWSVLKGDMSLVGPRPLLIEYLDFYTPEERRRHTVRPGLTGLAQVSGRNNLPWDDRLQADIQYVANRNLLLDLRILLLTLIKVLRKEGIDVVPSTRIGKLSEVRRHHASSEFS